MGIWSGLTSNSRSHASIFERYTKDLQHAIELAQREAFCRGESLVSAADLLAGLMEEEDTRAARVGSLKSNATYLRWLLELPAPTIRPAHYGDDIQTLPFDAEARRAFASMVLEADRDREYWIDTDHLLRGLLRFPNRADFAVLKTELDLYKLRAASRSDRHKFPPQLTPNLKVAEYLVGKYLRWLAPPAISIACYLYILIEGLGSAILWQTR